MALRLRRGTNAERLAITPVEGELVYTTDTKQLFVGDGTTSGGVAVAVGGGISINDLLDVNTTQGDSTQPADGEGLVWDADNGEWRPGTVSGGGGTVASLNDIGDVNTVGVSLNDTLRWDGAEWIADAPSAPSISSLNEVGDVNTSGASPNDFLKWNGSLWIPDAVPAPSSLLDIGDVVEIGSLTTGQALVWEDTAWNNISVLTSLSADANPTLGGNLNGSNFSISNISSLSTDGIITAEEFNGRFQGDIINDSSSVVFNSFTNDLLVNNITANSLTTSGNISAEIITAEQVNARIQGDIVNSSSTLVFDSGTNNLTVNNITANAIDSSSHESSTITATTSLTSPLFLDTSRQINIGNSQFPHRLVISNDSGAGTDDFIRIFSNNTTAIDSGIRFNISRGSITSPTSIVNGDRLGKIAWKAHNGTNYIQTSYLEVRSTGSYIAGTDAMPSRLTVYTGSSDGLTAYDAYTFRDGTIFADNFFALNDITGNLKGSVFADNSSLLIDGTNGSIYVANVDIVGNTGNSPADTGTVDSWLEISVNGATKYIPLYD